MELHLPGFEMVDRRGTLPVRLGARPYRLRPGGLSAIRGICLHHSGVDLDSSAEAIAVYQTGPSAHEPFPAIAYSFVVRWAGRIEWCHDLETRTWHAGPGNDGYVGVCLVGLHRPKPRQLAATSALIEALDQAIGPPQVEQQARGEKLEVRAHAEFMPTSCPGEGWEDWVPSLKSHVPSPEVGEPEPQPGTWDAGPGTFPVVHGFRTVYDRLGPTLCGAALETERGMESGTEQEFERVLMRWLRDENRVWVHLK